MFRSLFLIGSNGMTTKQIFQKNVEEHAGHCLERGNDTIDVQNPAPLGCMKHHKFSKTNSPSQLLHGGKN